MCLCVSWSCGLDLGLKLNSNPESEFYDHRQTVSSLFQVYLLLISFLLHHKGGLLYSVYLCGVPNLVYIRVILCLLSLVSQTGFRLN